MPGNTAGTIDVPLEVFGGTVSDLAPNDLPQGSSPDSQDVAFQVGLVRTRPGLQDVGYPPIAGGPAFNYLKTYITQQQVLRMMSLDSSGNVYKENPIGTLQPIGAVTPGEYCLSVSQFTREYMAFGDGKFGLDIPRQYDDTNFDRVSQVGPGAPPVVTDEAAYNMTAAVTGALGTVPAVASQFGVAVAIASISQVGNLVTVTFVPGTGNFAFFNGESVTIAGAPAGYNGTFKVTWPVQRPTARPGAFSAPSSFTYIAATSGLGAGAGGTAVSNAAAFALDLATFRNFPGNFNGYISQFPAGLSVTVAGVGVGGYNGTWTTIGLMLWSTPCGAFTCYGPSIVANIGSTGLANSSGGTLTVNGNIPAGVHGVSVIFVTRQGALFISQVTGSWTSAGNKRAAVSVIPVGPPNIVARIIVFTLAGGQSYYYLTGVNQIAGSNFKIPDNVTTTALLDFTDAILAAGTSADYLFKLVELGECSGVIDYALRNFWWGERNKVQNFNNLTFDGGFSNPGSAPNFPLGWTPDPVSSPGGGSALALDPSFPLWGDAYAIQGDGVTAIRGLISQSAYQDSNGVPIIQPNTQYSVRVRIKGNLAAQVGVGNVHINLFSASAGINTGITVSNVLQFYQEFIGVLGGSFAVVPSDLQLQVYMDGTPTNGGAWFIENIEPFPTTQPYNTSLVRGSRVEDPESYDGVNGIMQYGENDGTRITGAFKLRDSLYFVKERSIWQTKDDGLNEPSKWAINQISTIIGTPSNRGIGIGSDWVVIAGRLGLYYFDGGEPEKISQEIQKSIVQPDGTILPGWDSINWQYANTVWCMVDEKNRRIMVGAPTGAAVTPNVVFVLDYRGLDTGRDITQHKSIHVSAYTGKIYEIADSRKWTRWNMNISSAGQIERPDGTFHIFMGNGAHTGKIYDLLDVENFTTPSQFGDDGVAINSYYDTYFFLRPQEEEQYQMGSHRKLYHYLTSYIEGQGIPTLTAFPPGNAPGIPLPQSGNTLRPLVSPLFTTTITSISRTLNVVTVVTAAPHNLTPTSDVVIRGTGNAAFDNLVFGNLGIVNSTTFNFILNGPNIVSIPAGNINPLLRDLEMVINVLTERCKFRVQTNALGSWFSLRTLTPSIKTDPWAPVRGIN